MKVAVIIPNVSLAENGRDIARVSLNLAEALSQSGCEVTIFHSYGNGRYENKESRYILENTAPAVRLVRLENINGPAINATFYTRKAYLLYLRLKTENYNVIHFPDVTGIGFYCFLAKHQGLAFIKSKLTIGLHGSTLSRVLGNCDLVDDLSYLERDYLERQCVALADAVISPGKWLLDSVFRQNWVVSGDIETISSLYFRECTAQQEIKVKSIRNLIFVGVLDLRRGLALFCDALDRMVEQGKPDDIDKVIFLGVDSFVHGQSSKRYIKTRSSSWSFKTKIQFTTSLEESAAYLVNPNSLAVLPNNDVDSTYAITVCLNQKIPFITCNEEEVTRQVAEPDRERVYFRSSPNALLSRILEILGGTFRPALKEKDTESEKNRWVKYFNSLYSAESGVPEPSGLDGAEPLVSVCLTHFNRPGLLSQAIDSLRIQSYGNYEVVLVDDGSTSLPAIKYLDSLEEEFRNREWKIVRQDNQYLGAARNTAASHARGEYLLFMDDDNIALPDEIATFVKAAITSQADILTCVLYMDFSTEYGNDGKGGALLSTPIGGDLSTGMFRNCFGDANALVRSEVFRSLQGYSEDYGTGNEDWEFFSKAVVNGFKLQVVPEPLMRYRMKESGMLLSGAEDAGLIRAIRPYVDKLGAEYRGSLLLSQAVYTRSARSLPSLLKITSGLIVALGAFLSSPSKKEISRRFVVAAKSRGLKYAIQSVIRYG